MLLYQGEDADEITDGHEGYVSGQHADGTHTTIWTVVKPQDDNHFIAYIPRCECGWTGPSFSPTPAGYAACEHLWQEQHLRLFLAHRTVPKARWPSTPVIDGTFVPEL
jgi:hypothetical protein